MTSKEALKYLLVNSEELYNQYEEDEKFYLDAVELYNIVLKDIEKLEIIKTTIYRKEEHKYKKKKKMKGEKFMILSIHIRGTDNVNKIKEWLGNDNFKK